MPFFDPQAEIAARFCNAATFGCSKENWYFLVQAANSCQLLAGVDPVLLSRLPEGKAGASLLLYGQAGEYEIRFEIDSGELLLLESPLDPPPLEPTVAFSGRVQEASDWRILVIKILLSEGVTLWTYDQATEDMKRRGML